MKVRSSFVTNSSSSSFVIAIKKDAKLENIKEIVKENEKYISSSLKDYCYDDDEIKVEDVINEVAEKFYSFLKYSSIEIGDWKIVGQTMSNEDDIPDCIIYSCFSNIETDILKVMEHC